MLSKIYNKIFLISLFILTAWFQVGCSEETPQEETELVTVSGTLSGGSAQQKAGFQKVSAQSLSDYQVYCVTFTSPSRSAVAGLDSTGQFSLMMPAGVAFGCFINNASTGQPVATMAIQGEDNEFGGTSSTSIQLVGNANLGVLQLDLERGEVLIPRSNIEQVLQPITETGLNLDDIHNSTYDMQCLSSGNAIMDQVCADFMEEDDETTVFFRIMRATRNGEGIQGLGVWESEQAFNDCGGIDLTDQAVAGLGTDEGIQFLQGGVLSGPSFSVGSNCPLREQSQAASHENLDRYYAAGELIREGSGYALSVHDSHLANPGCRVEHHTRVLFTGDNPNRMVGQFWGSKTLINLNNGQGDCSHLGDEGSDSFVVEFIKQ